MRKYGRRQTIDPPRSQYKTGSEPSLALLQHRQIRLGHTKPVSCLHLAQPLTVASLSKIVGNHGDLKIITDIVIVKCSLMTCTYGVFTLLGIREHRKQLVPTA